MSFISRKSPTRQPTSPRPSSRTERVEDPTSPGRSKQKQLLSSVSRLRSATPEQSLDLSRAPPRMHRSRSEANMATLAKLERLPSMSSEVSEKALSQHTRNPTADWRHEGPVTIARSLLHKSSRYINKRKSTAKLGPQTTWTDDVVETTSTPSQESFRRRRSVYSRGSQRSEHSTKNSISEPYDFQHLTHTSSSHAKVLRSASQGELITEFSALRASQAPKRQLKGIRADDIPSGASSEVVSLASPAVTRPTTPHSLHGAKSIDSFTRLASRSFSTPMPPISPPPRRSSRKPPPMMAGMMVVTKSNLQDSATPLGPTSPVVDSAASPGATSTTLMEAPMVASPIEASNLEIGSSPAEIAQAVTTPDDTACMILNRTQNAPPSLTSLPLLEDVPEEEENAVQSEIQETKSKVLRHTKSFPSIKHFSRSFSDCKWGSHNNLKAEWTLYEAYQSTEEQQPKDVPTEPARRMSYGTKAVQESWEDSIDYCYEHAMEAEGSDWEGLEMSGGVGKKDGQDRSLERMESLSLSIPDLQPETMVDSATSSSVSVPGIVTPSGPLSSLDILGMQRDMGASAFYPLTPSLLIPKEYSSRVTHEESYHQSLSETEPKHGYTFYHHHLDSEIAPSNYSPRSSGCPPLSKSTSRDDLTVSRSASCSGSRHERNSSSLSSVPELIRSKSSGEHLIASAADAASSGTTLSIASTIDSMRQDFIKQAEDIPEEEFGAISPTLSATTQSSFRSRSNSDSAGRILAASAAAVKVAAATAAAASAASSPMTAAAAARLRSTSAATPPVMMKPKGHRSSYSLFPQASRI